MGVNMLDKKLADKLTLVATEQLREGLEAKKSRMDVISEIIDLYNNKTLDVGDGMMNIPFPVMAGQVDLMYSKIDNPPTLTFKVPNKKTLSEKVQAAWVQESSSTRAGWKRKDRSEKKMAVMGGRAVCKVFASSVNNQYRSHYELVDIFSFVADPTRGDLEEGNYHGETDIFKTHTALKNGALAGIYDMANVVLLLSQKETIKDGSSQVVDNKFNRLSALGVDVATSSFAGQEGVLLTEWVMRYEDEWYYLLFEPNTRTWVRAEKLEDVFENGKTHFVSWATNYDAFSFWSKGPADDWYPIAEAIRFILNNALENEKRRARPMRIVKAGDFVDVSELQDYVPDNVIIANREPNVITVETPDAQASINIAQFLDAMIQAKSGVNEPGTQSTDAKVGVYYGKLQQEADRVGAINKEYSESYAHKGYRFFWGLKQHLTKSKQVEMLGRTGIKLQELSRFDFKDVDDVDDVLVSGGSADQETNAVEQQQKNTALSEVMSAFPQIINPRWAIKAKLKNAGFDDDDIREAIDSQALMDTDQIEEADQAIQDIMLGNMPDLNNAAEIPFVDRIVNYARTELNWVKLDKNGNETGEIDKKTKEQFDKLLAYVKAHQNIVMANEERKVAKEPIQQPQGDMNVPEAPEPSQQYQRQQLAQPGEKMTPVPGTPSGTAAMSQNVTGAMRR
jgi:hypothetical protein